VPGGRDRRRAFRLDTGFPGKISLRGETGFGAAERGCFICNMSESGCKAAIEGATAEDYDEGRDVLVVFYGRQPLALTGRVARLAETVEGWGVSVGVVFEGLDRAKRHEIRVLLGSANPHIERRSSRGYRSRCRRKQVQKAAITAAALVVGFAAVLVVKQIPGAVERQASQLRQHFVRLIQEEWQSMDPRERQAMLDDMARDEPGAYRRMIDSLSEEEKRAVYDSLTDEEKARVRELYEESER
jgi:hypothetical protein